MADIDFKSINELKGMDFFIPNYQRGYRWDAQNVVDLLNDLYEFIMSKGDPSGSYCLQPLVVKRYEKHFLEEIKNAAQSVEDVRRILNRWEVIDGQQRLTTLFIIIKCFTETNPWSINYQTRPGSWNFLNDISNKSENSASTNVDFFCMLRAFRTTQEWLNRQGKDFDAQAFVDAICKRVKVIWYDTDEPNPIKVFTRLNIGKISLTDAELIKAMVLCERNYKEAGTHSVFTIREEASVWDSIERKLQDNQYWYFICNEEYKNSTRIEYLFQIIQEKDIMGYKQYFCDTHCVEEWDKLIGTDEHRLFRYYYALSQDADFSPTMVDVWEKAKSLMDTIKEWYDSLELYHYVGYLIALDRHWSVFEIYDVWNASNNKQDFKLQLMEIIKKEIARCNVIGHQFSYEDGGKGNKTDCRPLLLLHNVQTAINNNNHLREADKYQMTAFYKFPFHLYKKEGKKENGKGWEMEHIASNSGDTQEEKHAMLYLHAAKVGITDDKLRKEIDQYKYTSESYEGLRQKVNVALGTEDISAADKNKIWNFVLLDSTTNEEYQNAVFPFKRICVLAKERGRKCTLTYNKEDKTVRFDDSNPGVAFVPICTKNIFTKAYTESPVSLHAWTRQDAIAYRRDIEQTLTTFLSLYYKKLSTLKDEERESWYKMEEYNDIKFLEQEMRKEYGDDVFSDFEL